MMRFSHRPVEVDFLMMGGDVAADLPLFAQRSFAMTEDAKLPVKKFRAGRVTAAVFRHEHTKDDRQVVSHSVNVELRYRDKKTGEWKSSTFFYADDLPRLELVAKKAFEFIVLDNTDASTS